MLALVYCLSFLCVLIRVTIIFDEGSKLVKRALLLEDAIENTHSERRAAPAFGNLTNIPSQYWNQNQSYQSLPLGQPYPSLQPLANCTHQVSCSGLNSQQIEDYSAFNEAMKRMLENDNDVEKAKLGNEQCAAMLTLGFNKFTRFGSKKLADLHDDVKGEIDKSYEGKVVPCFWLRQHQMQTNAQNNNPK